MTFRRGNLSLSGRTNHGHPGPHTHEETEHDMAQPPFDDQRYDETDIAYECRKSLEIAELLWAAANDDDPQAFTRAIGNLLKPAP